MKKFVCLFVCICTFICCVFATTNVNWNDEVKVTAKVGEITVSEAAQSAAANGDALYNLYGGLENYAGADSKLVDARKDVAEEDVSVYFRIFQAQKVKTQETIHLYISAGPMYLNGITSGTPADLNATDLPVISNIQGNPLTGAYSVGTSNITANGFTFDVSYLNRTIAVADRDIGYFLAKWTHVPGLANGIYTASITMTLETN